MLLRTLALFRFTVGMGLGQLCVTNYPITILFHCAGLAYVCVLKNPKFIPFHNGPGVRVVV